MRSLIVAASSPFRAGPSGGGGEQRSLLMYEALQELGRVDVLMLYERPGDPPQVSSTAPFLIEGCWPSGPMRSRRWTDRGRMNRAVAGLIDYRNYDVICGRHLWPIGGLRIPADRKVIVDLDDLHYTFSANRPRLERIFQRSKMGLDFVLESAAMRRYSACWFVSTRDQKRHPRFLSRILPNVPLPPKSVATSQSTDPEILFVGSLWYQPNQEAVEWFLSRCWPRIRQLEPAARFKIVGSGRDDDRMRWSAIAGVDAPGFVPDLAMAYASAAMTVAPIFSGGGSNIKVLESLAHRRACLTTTFASGAFQPYLRRGEHLAVVDTEDDWVETCVALLRDRDRRTRLAEAGKSVVDRVFSPTAFRTTVQELVLEVSRQDHSSTR